MTNPRVWIGCLASYNAGRLIGEWVDATDVGEMNECRARVAKLAVAAAKEAGEYPVYFGEPEEFYVGDYDDFGVLGRQLGEYPNYETVAKIGALVEEYGAEFIAYVDVCELDLDEVDEDDFQAARRHEWPSEKDFAESVVRELGWGGVPSQTVVYSEWPKVELNPIEELIPHLDMESIAREMFRHGNYTSRDADGGGVWVFETQL